jgi:hypothetical protein
MVKIELEIPDNYLGFIREFIEWEGAGEDVPAFILRAIKSKIECEIDYVHNGAPKRAVALVKKYGLQDQCTFRHQLNEAPI